jgi:hypothetical protein
MPESTKQNSISKPTWKKPTQIYSKTLVRKELVDEHHVNLHRKAQLPVTIPSKVEVREWLLGPVPLITPSSTI